MGTWTGSLQGVLKVGIVWKDSRADHNIKGQTINMPTGSSGATIAAVVNSLALASQCSIPRLTQTLTYGNDDFSASTTGENSNYTVLKFEDSLGYKGDFEARDLANACFSVANSNEVKPYATLAAASAGTPEKGLADFIDAVLAGDVIVKSSAGEAVTVYVSGTRANH